MTLPMSEYNGHEGEKLNLNRSPADLLYVHRWIIIRVARRAFCGALTNKRSVAGQVTFAYKGLDLDLRPAFL